jgi:hypothetical protein
MNPVGSISVGPTDREVEVGSFSLEEGADTLWVDVQQMSPNQVWNYSYGLLWWESAFGRELGTEKVYGHQIGETFRLGVGRTPRSRDGRIMFAPRAYNRRWISIENPPTWTLSFSAESNILVPSVPVVVNSFVRASDGSGLQLVQVDFS